MLSCKDVATVASGLGLEELTPGRRLAVYLHLLACRSCRLYVRQIKRLSELARISYREETPEPEELVGLEQEILAQLFDAPDRGGRRG